MKYVGDTVNQISDIVDVKLNIESMIGYYGDYKSTYKISGDGVAMKKCIYQPYSYAELILAKKKYG